MTDSLEDCGTGMGHVRAQGISDTVDITYVSIPDHDQGWRVELVEAR
jgi:hypothetical protein